MVENKKDIRKHHGGPMGKGPGFAGVADKPKDFSKTLKRLIKYIGKYNKVILLVVFVLICSTILSTLSPKTSLTVSLKIVAVVLAKRSASKALVEVATNENINEFSDCTTSIALSISCTVILMP